MFKQLISIFRILSMILAVFALVLSASLASASNESAPFSLDLRLSFAEWTLAAGVPPADAQADAVAGPLGIPNLAAYGLGLDPLEGDAADLPRLSPDAEDPDAVILTYTLNRDSAGVSVRIEQSANMSAWSEVIPMRDEFIEEVADGVEKRAIQIERDATAGRGFFRVSVEANP